MKLKYIKKEKSPPLRPYWSCKSCFGFFKVTKQFGDERDLHQMINPKHNKYTISWMSLRMFREYQDYVTRKETK